MSASLHPPEVIYGRQAYKPEWQVDPSKSQMETPVTQDGKKLGFKIGQMLPERWWTVNVETGELISQRDFESLWEKYVSYHVPVGSREVVSIRRANEYFDEKLAPVPRVEIYASRALDWQGKEISIGFDPDAKADVREEEIKVYDSNGEEVRPGLFQRPSDVVARLGILNDLKARGRLTESEYVEEVAQLTATPTASAAPEIPAGFSPAKTEEEAQIAVTARCGKVCASAAGKAAHERHCSECNPAEESRDGG